MDHTLQPTSRRALTITLVSVFLCLLMAGVVVPALAATATFSGDTSTNPDGSMQRPVDCVSLNFARLYKAHPFYVSADGSYTTEITDANFFDTMITLYQNSFDVADPLANCIVEDDDSGAGMLSRITQNLDAGTQYILVVYGFGGATGSYDGEISGPGNITLGYLSSDDTSDDAPQPVRPDDRLPVRPDDRLNWKNGDDLAVIYSRDDDVDNPAIHVYCVGENSQGVIGLVITQADLAGIARPPAANTLVASSELCDVEFYVLTTGEYQVNIREDSGKIFVTVMADLAGTGAYGYLLVP